MGIKKFDELSFDVIETLKNATEELAQTNNDTVYTDEPDYALHVMLQDWYIESKDDYGNDFIKKYFQKPSDEFSKILNKECSGWPFDIEEVTTLKLDKDKWVVLGFDDSYEGLRFTFEMKDGKLNLVECIEADENMCNVEGMYRSDIYYILYKKEYSYTPKW